MRSWFGARVGGGCCLPFPEGAIGLESVGVAGDELRCAEGKVGFPVFEWHGWQISGCVPAGAAAMVADFVAVGGEAGKELGDAVGFLRWEILEPRLPRVRVVGSGHKRLKGA